MPWRQASRDALAGAATTISIAIAMVTLDPDAITKVAPGAQVKPPIPFEVWFATGIAIATALRKWRQPEYRLIAAALAAFMLSILAVYALANDLRGLLVALNA